MTALERDRALERVDYYLKIDSPFEVPEDTPQCRLRKTKSIFFFDFQKLIRFYPLHYRYFYRFGDNISVPGNPTFVKARPISEANTNSVLLKLDSVRHFRLTEDPMPFDVKKPVAVFRGACHQQHRREFLKLTAGIPGTDIGDTRKSGAEPGFQRAYLSVPQQREYKFILSVEGNDVATNLKWILSSNSLCFMRRPRCETWFMEGRLEAGRHFVALNDDYSDLGDKMDFYNRNPGRALEIIRNAQAHVAQFRDPRGERNVGLMVLAKYFALSGQLNPRLAALTGPAGPRSST
jgi:hypothetical protein